MIDRVFVDTNVLVYAHHVGAGARHELAVELVERWWHKRTAVLSTQVIQELYVNLRRKVVPPLSRRQASQLVDDYLVWPVVVNDGSAIREAIEFEQRYRLSFWDALIVQAANAASVAELYTEDLNHGQRYDQVVAVNPFVGLET